MFVQKLITIGIPTYYGGPSIVKTVKSILSSNSGIGIKIIVSVDGNPLKKEIEKELIKMGTIILFNKKQGGQVVRIKQLINECNTKILILTQDDVLFHPLALQKIIDQFYAKKPTMIGVKVIPPKPHTFIEKILKAGVNITYRIVANWNYADNYLAASGRCLAFQTDFIKKFKIPDKVINSDAYLYFENKRNKGTFKFVEDAIVYIKSPQTIQEHIKQSNKFKYSKQEVESLKMGNPDLNNEYKFPKLIVLKSFLQEYLSNAIYCTLYFAVFLYSRMIPVDKKQYKTGIWKTDASTKEI